MSFQKAVVACSVSTSGLALQSAAGAGLGSRQALISAVSGVCKVQGRVVMVTVGSSDLTTLEYNAAICSVVASCYLRFGEGIVEDYLGNLSVGRLSEVAVGTCVGDQQAPTLVSFVSINMNTSQLQLSFSEPINASSLKAQVLQLQSLLENPSSQITLAGAMVAGVSQQGMLVTVQLSSSDVNAIELDGGVCAKRFNCYVWFPSSLVRDIAGNAVASVALVSPGQIVQSFVGDGRAPELSAYTLDMRLGQLSLTFNKPVFGSLLQVNKLQIQNASGTGPGVASVGLTGGTLNSSGDGLIVVVVFSTADMSSIQATPGLGKSANSTFLVAQAGLVRDLVSPANQFAGIASGVARGCDQYVGDDVPPTLQQFVLDLSAGLLRLSFSEPMQGSVFDASKLSVQNASSLRLPAQVTLSAQSYASAVDGATSITVSLSAADLALIKTTSNLATDVTTTYLTVASGLVKDMAGNDAVVISSAGALAASGLVADGNLARLSNFSLDMNAGVLRLTFNSLVNPATLQVGGLSLQATAAASVTGVVALTAGSSSSNSSVGYVVTVFLGAGDVLAVKQRPPIARSLSTTFLTLVGALQDYRGNDVLAVTNGFALRAGQYVADTTAVAVTGFDYNASQPQVTVRFSKAVNVSSFDATQLVLQNAGASASAWYAFTAASNVTVSNDLTEVSFVVIGADAVAIQLLTALAVSQGSTFLSYSGQLVKDVIGLPTAGRGTSAGLAAASYGADVVAVRVTGFDLDLTNQSMALYFNRVVNMSFFNLASSCVVQSTAASTAVSVALTTSTGFVQAGLQVFVALSTADFNSIKSASGLAVSSGSSFLSCGAGSFASLAGLSSESISSSQALRVQSYVGDTVAPMLVSFGFSMQSGTVLLTFSEPVAPSTLSVYNLQLQDAGASAVRVVTLAAHGVSGAVSTRVNATVTNEVLNAIKASVSIGRLASGTFLAGGAGFIRDTSDNNISSILSSAARQAAFVEGDTVAPRLLGFDFVVGTGLLTLSFSETVNASTLVGGLITVSSASVGGVSYTLTGLQGLCC